jgi:hypothetical protein
MWKNAIRELRSLDYSVFLKEGGIGYKYYGFYGGRAPDAARVAPLVEAIKSDREKAAEYLATKDFDAIYHAALDAINRKYLSGAIEYTKGFIPGLWREIIDAEEKLSEIWLAGEDFEEFKISVDALRNLFTKASESFKEQEHGK